MDISSHFLLLVYFSDPVEYLLDPGRIAALSGIFSVYLVMFGFAARCMFGARCLSTD